jgi:3-hydroxyacyl-CoA dehydrogenase
MGLFLFYDFSRYPNEPSFIVPQCLMDKVNAGDLGRKSGKGFYFWDGEKVGKAVH